MYATQIELRPRVDFVLVRIREPKAPQAIEAANAAHVDPEIALARTRSGQEPRRLHAAFVRGAEHVFFVAALAAIGCLEALALLT